MEEGLLEPLNTAGVVDNESEKQPDGAKAALRPPPETLAMGDDEDEDWSSSDYSSDDESETKVRPMICRSHFLLWHKHVAPPPSAARNKAKDEERP